LGLKKGSAYSQSNEEEVIQRSLAALPAKTRFCVDIAAGDGITMSNTYSLFKSGWGGLAVEGDGRLFRKLVDRYAKFPRAQFAKTMVTPDTVVPLLKSHSVPRDFDFLSLDIDGYDHFVLQEILGAYRPFLICAEVNEKIPPPLKFTVKYDPAYVWREDHFYGQSLAMLEELARDKRYALIALEYNNAFLVPEEHSAPFPSLSVAEAYRKGYLDKPDRLQRMPWNRDMEALQSLAPTEGLKFVARYFERDAGRYICRL